MPKPKSKPRSKQPANRKSGGGGRGGAITLLVVLALIAGFIYILASHPALRESLLHGSSAPRSEQSEPVAPPAAPQTKTPVEQPHAATKALDQKMATVAKDAPFSPSEDVFESAAKLYTERCATCHGTPRAAGPAAASLRALAPKSNQAAAAQFWLRAGAHTLDPLNTGQVHDRIANGQPPAMPAYAGQLTDTQIWQLSLLLKANQLELPDPVRTLLNHPVTQ